MTVNRHIKRRVRARMKTTGQSYTQALMDIRKERAERECFACGGKGHVKSHCPVKAAEENKPFEGIEDKS